MVKELVVFEQWLRDDKVPPKIVSNKINNDLKLIPKHVQLNPYSIMKIHMWCVARFGSICTI